MSIGIEGSCGRYSHVDVHKLNKFIFAETLVDESLHHVFLGLRAGLKSHFSVVFSEAALCY